MNRKGFLATLGKLVGGIGALLRGRIFAEGNEPAVGIGFYAKNEDGQWEQFATTDAEGRY